MALTPISNGDSGSSARTKINNAFTEVDLKVSTGDTGTVTNTMLAGSIALSKLALTGTPDGTKFIRDDGSYQAINLPLTIGTSTITGGTSGNLLYNNGGLLGGLATTGGGNGEADFNKIPTINVEGGINLGSYSNVNGNTLATMRVGLGNALAIGVDVYGMGLYSELNGTGSVAVHAHVSASGTGNNIGFQGDITGGTGVNYLIQGVARSTGYFMHGYEHIAGLQYDRFTINAQGDHSWYKNGTTLTTGTDKTSLVVETPAGTGVYTLKAGRTGDLISTGDTGTVTDTMLAGSITPSKVTGTAAILGANTFTELQTITQGSVNTGIFTSTGYSLTGSNATNAFDIAGTLNTSGNPSVMQVAMTTTAAGSTTALARFLGTTTGTANVFAVLAPVANAQASASIQIGAGLFCGEYTASASWWFGVSNNKFAGRFAIDSIGVSLANNGYYAFGNDTFANSSPDLTIRRRAAAWLGLGTASATPIEQTLSGCDGSGTNITGGVLNISAGRGTGTGISGVLNFRSHAAAASSSTVNASPVTVMQITNTTSITISDAVNFTLGTTTGTKWGVSTSAKQAWWGAAPVVQQVLATGGGATVDNVISLLQTLGLCKQS